MFKNKHLQVKIVQDEPQPVQVKTTTNNEDFYDKLTVITVEVENIIKKVAVATAGYVLLDTFRKVMIEHAKH